MKLTEEHKETLKLESLNLKVGESTRDIQCPVCLRSKDCSITRVPNGLLFNCFRVGCGASGFVSSRTSGKVVKPKPKIKLFRYPTVSLSGQELRFLIENFHLTKPQIDANHVKWCHELQRVIYPCFDSFGNIWAYNARYYPELAAAKKQGEVKSIKYVQTNESCRVAWAKRASSINYDSSVTVLVEDQVSAICMAEYFNSVALLGTNIPQEIWNNIRGTNVVLILDADAQAKAAKQIVKYSPMAKTLRAISIEKDIKDMTHEQRSRLVDHIKRTVHGTQHIKSGS